MGAAARTRFPAPVTRAAIKLYSRYFSVALEDVDPRVVDAGFASFDEFFTRRLKADARPVASAPDLLVAPSDGALRESVAIEGGTEVRAKGHAYTIGALLGDDELADSFVGGLATTIYLHPRDYHRVHAPCEGTARQIIAIPGRLLPVTDAAVERDAELFARNERVVHLLESAFGPVAVVMVAAFGVGHMSCCYAKVEAHPKEVQRITPAPVQLARGGELGIFHLGSTVVMLSPKGTSLAPMWRKALDAGEMPSVRMGMPMLEVDAKAQRGGPA